MVIQCSTIDDIVCKFRYVEHIPNAPTVPPDDNRSSYSSGTELCRYIVEFPFSPIFEGSRDVSLENILSLERCLLRNSTFYAQYPEIIQDYLDPSHYFLPHHCVSKIDNSGPKIRVVFKASLTATNGISFNDTLLIGSPTIHFVNFIKISSLSRKNITTFFGDFLQKYFLKIVTYGDHSSPFSITEL